MVSSHVVTRSAHRPSVCLQRLFRSRDRSRAIDHDRGALQQTAKTHFLRRLFQVKHGISNHFAHHRTVLKTVAGAPAHDPDIPRIRVAIQDKIVVCRVLVLAYPAFN